jgi:hypothetical protein
MEYLIINKLHRFHANLLRYSLAYATDFLFANFESDYLYLKAGVAAHQYLKN